MTKHVVEANSRRRVKLLSGAPFDQDAELLVVASDVFDGDRDLPDPDETVTIATGESVVRGTITEIVYLVEVAE